MSPFVLYTSQSPSVPDIFAYGKDHLPKTLSLKELLTAIPAGLQVPLDELITRIRLTTDPNATEESVKDILYGEGIPSGLQVIPSFDGRLTVGHTDKSSSLYLDIGSVNISLYDYLTNRLDIGTGEAKDDCGDIDYWGACSSNPDHPRVPYFIHCDRLECPVCYTRRISRAAENIAGLTEGFKDSLKADIFRRTGKKGKVYSFRHFSFSPSEEEWHSMMDKARDRIISEGKADDMYKLIGPYFKREITKWAHIWIDASGLKAYNIILHPERIKDEYKEFCQDLADMKNEVLPPGKPKYNRYTVLKGNPNKAEYVYFSPHIHTIAYGMTIPTDEWKKAFPNVNLKNHSADKKPEYQKLKKQTPKETVKAIAYYLLTHAALVKSEKGTYMDTYTYGGYLHSSKLRKMKVCPACGEKNNSALTFCEACGDPLYKTEYCNCKACGDLLVRVDVVDDVIHYPEIEKPITRKVTEYLYFFLKSPPGMQLPAVRIFTKE